MKTEKRFLLLLTLALMLGLMPGMNTKVLAETATYKVSVTITNLTKSSTNDPWQSTGTGFPKYIEVSTEAGGSHIQVQIHLVRFGGLYIIDQG